MKNSIIYLGLLMLLTVTAHAQITPNGNSGSTTTAYTNGAPNDAIYIWCSEGLATAAGSLTASYTAAPGPFTFRWYYHNQNTSSWALYTTQTGTTSTISNLASDGYRVQIYNSSNTLLACYNAWVWNMNGEVTASAQMYSCDTAGLSGSVLTNGSFTYYNPPPPEAIITAATQINVCFTANHTYVSDLAFYLVGPNGVTIPLAPNPGALGQNDICNSGNNVNNLCFSNTSTANLNVCSAAVPLTGNYGTYGPNSTAINWAPLIGINAAQGGWAVQIYDCIGADTGSLTNANISFSNLDASCGAATSISYSSGSINSAINDNSCSAATASIFTVPPSPVLSTPIVINATTNYLWTSTVPIASPTSLSTEASGIPEGTTNFDLTAIVTYGSTSCTYSDETSVYREPIVLGTPVPLYDCQQEGLPYNFNLSENDALIRNGLDPNYFIVTYHASQFDAEEGVPTIPAAYSTLASNTTVFVRVEDYETACFKVTSFQLIGTDAPEPDSPPALEACDDDGDRQFVFDLTVQDSFVLAGYPPDEFVVTYYTSFNDADGNVNDITNPQAYDGTCETMYVRVTNIDNEDCYGVTSFMLKVSVRPAMQALTTVEICDDDNDDNVAEFDLAETVAAIRDNNPLLTLAITMYASEAEAENGGTPLSLPIYTTNQAVSQNVFFRVEEEADVCSVDDCFTIIPLELIVHPKPEIPAIADFHQCDVNNSPDGIEEFDLLVKNDEITGSDPNLTVSYYLTEADASAEVPANAIAAPASYINTASPDQQTIWVRVETPEGCYAHSSFLIIVDPLPEPAVGLVYNSCETAPGQAEFDLHTQDAAITQNTPGMTVDYYETFAAAEIGDNDFITDNPYTSGSKIVYARVENTATGCFTIAELELDAVEFPELGTATPLEVCDSDSNPAQLYGTFNLTPAIDEILNGEPGLVATVHTTLTNAEQNIAPQPQAAFTNTEADGTQTVFVRIELTGSNPVCYSVETIDLIVNPKPVIPSITTFEQCDENNSPDGVEEFDLTVKNDEITGADPSLTVSYYLTQADASAPVPTNAIAAPDSHSNTASPNQQTIWVRVENAQGCYSTRSFLIRVNPLPVIDSTPEPLYSCEETANAGEFDLSQADAGITQGNANYTVRYYETQLAADNGGNDNITENPYSGGGTVYVRVDNPQTGCYVTTTLELEVIPAPIATTPDPLEECDFNNDGVAAFNLDAVIAQIIAELGNVDVTIHETMFDAEFNENAITNTGAYTNIETLTVNGTQILYIRVQSDQTVCYDIVELELIVRPVPVATEPEPYNICDDNEDGQGVFDLSTREDEILGTLDPALYSFSYHTEQAHAQNGTPSISNPSNYLSGNDTIYVRITDNATGCYDIVELELIVNPLPIANDPLPYTLCDVNDNPGAEREVFDLTTTIPDITESAEGVNVTFHHTYEEAQLGDNEITNPTAYTNNTTVETLFVRVTTEATGCYRIVLLDIRVEPLPILVTPTEDERTVCDPDGDGIGVFDLDALVEDMVNNGVNLDVSFHWTAQDAENNLNPITNTGSFQNVTPFLQTIYVRAENTATGCVSSAAVALGLIVVPSPQMPDLEPIVICDEDSDDQDTETAVDLTQQDEVIYAAAGIGDDYIIHYFTDEDYAQAGAPRITNPGTYNGTDGQEIWVRAEDPATGCFGITSFTLKVGTPHPLTQPAQYTTCNEALPNDGQALFDLTTRDNEILGPFGVGHGYTVEYFEEQDDVDSNTPIANPQAYTNPAGENPKTLQVVVTTLEGCRSYTTLTIKVMPLPTPNFSPDALERCDDDSSPDGIERFDLTEADADIRSNDATTVLTYYTSLEDAEAGTNAIPVPTNHISGNATIYVRVEARSGNPADAVCYQVVELELIVNPLPVLGTAGVIAPFAHCEQNTDGYHEFLLTDHIGEILVGLDPAEYTVRFYLDATTMANGIALPFLYENEVPYDQTILVRVENNQTGCRETAPLRLLVEEGAIAYPVITTVLDTCDTDGTNDGVFTFDLTPAGAEALGAQDPADYSVAYYETPEDAEAATNAIADPTAYMNTDSPDDFEIFIRITNTTTISGCNEITSFMTIVEQLPDASITADGTTICVEYGTDITLRPLELRSSIDEPGYTYQWYFGGNAIGVGGNSATYMATEAGDYTLEITGPAPLSCTSDMSAAFTVIRSGPASIVGQGYTVSNYFSEDQVVTIDVDGYGTYEYKMDNGPWQDSNVFTNVTPGTHTVYVRDTGSCSEYEVPIEGVSIVDYPRFFTPNGDGYNDTWRIIGLGDQAASSKVYIFDRFGKLIKQISTGGEGWDGTFNGTPMPATDYWFTISYEEDGVQREFKAHFALKR